MEVGEALNININAQQVSNTTDMVMQWTIIILLILIVVAALALVLYFLKFKHKAHIMHITGSTLIHKYDKARVWRDKKGILWLKLMKSRYKGQVPDASARGVTNKGKYHFDLYYLEEKGFIFADQRSEKIIENLNKPQKRLDGQSINDNLECWATEDRTLMIIQQEESEQFKNFSWKEWLSRNAGVIMGIAGLAVLFILFIVAMDTMMPHLTQVSADRASEAQAQKVLGKAINKMVDYMNSTIIQAPPVVIPS